MSNEPTTLLVGAATAIGRGLAGLLAARGDSVILADADHRSLDEVAASAGLTDVNSKTYELDVRDGHAAEAMCSEIIEHFDRITYVFFDSEVARSGNVSELALVDWEAVLEGRVTAAYHLCQAVLPYMIEQNQGAIVLNSSDLAMTGVAGSASQVANHAAICSLTKALALEFAPHGVRINSIGQGAIEASSQQSMRDHVGSDDETGTKAIPMRRLGRPEEVAAVADFLLSDRASYITGQLIHANGGRTAW